ncbi:AraC family transcriptional regulator [Paenibacillus harenae]|uniref:YesN/AraC family two-component response regulator n=1 Tax=Paenibacillus harenae TaxID=306543 RepID=A0ABT9TTT5_PAEHA|nr:AraC family transcriptional regulator [Paenibacillus harenae]MDQ0110762.1 YesN/AraC family two-component response regulator [Paenibacillus harenae]
MSGALFKPEWMDQNVHPHVYAYYFKQWSNYSMNDHRHDSIEIMYVITGECRIELAATARRSERSISLKKNEFIILDANEPHRLIVDERGPCRMLNVEFDMQEKETAFPSIRQLASEDEDVKGLVSQPSSYLVLRDTNDLYPVLKNLVLELDNREKSSRVRTQLLFAQLIMTIARIYSDDLKQGANAADLYVKQATEYMHHHYDQDIQVKDIAAAVNLHPGYLHRLFTANTGKTITVYLTELRMEKAKMLLRQTDIAIADICDYVGAQSRQYFHAMFKKYTNQTPIAYRNSFHTHNMDGWSNPEGIGK